MQFIKLEFMVAIYFSLKILLFVISPHTPRPSSIQFLSISSMLLKTKWVCADTFSHSNISRQQNQYETMKQTTWYMAKALTLNWVIAKMAGTIKRLWKWRIDFIWLILRILCTCIIYTIMYTDSLFRLVMCSVKNFCKLKKFLIVSTHCCTV